jgi:putative ABC transport system substrate-binding protein
VKRRAFITLIGGAAVWPLAAPAQQMRRIGVLIGVRDAESEANVAGFLHVLQQLGWTDGTNVRIDVHWGTGDADTMRKLAAELAGRAPDVIFASGTSSVGRLLQASRTIPIVFANVADPVGAGFIDSLSHPGGNATGFIQFEYSFEREMAGTAQGDPANPDASRGSS